jgi:hypothetical protein
VDHSSAAVGQRRILPSHDGEALMRMLAVLAASCLSLPPRWRSHRGVARRRLRETEAAENGPH